MGFRQSLCLESNFLCSAGSSSQQSGELHSCAISPSLMCLLFQPLLLDPLQWIPCRLKKITTDTRGICTNEKEATRKIIKRSSQDGISLLKAK